MGFTHLPKAISFHSPCKNAVQHPPPAKFPHKHLHFHNVHCIFKRIKLYYMRKLIFALIILISSTVVSCSKSFKGIGFDPVIRDTALKMIDIYYDTVLVNHSIDSSVAGFMLTPIQMKWLTRDKKTDHVNFFLAAYLPSNGVDSMLYKQTVLVQLKKYLHEGMDSTYEYFDIGKPTTSAAGPGGGGKGKTICPPPPCRPVER
jgi:hypothetical protein